MCQITKTHVDGFSVIPAKSTSFYSLLLTKSSQCASISTAAVIIFMNSYVMLYLKPHGSPSGLCLGFHTCHFSWLLFSKMWIRLITHVTSFCTSNSILFPASQHILSLSSNFRPFYIKKRSIFKSHNCIFAPSSH